MGIADKQLYKAPYLYLINVWLKEYDLAKANISILYEEGVLSKTQYESFYNMPKQEREVSIGYMIRDNKDLYKVIQEGLRKARNSFLSINHIDDSNVLYVDNDSMTIIEPKRNNVVENHYITHFGNVIEFKMKNVYSSFYRLKDVDFLYRKDEQEEKYRVKYASIADKHINGFLEFLLALANEAETCNVLSVLQMIRYTHSQYLKGELDIEFYKEFNSISKYRFKQNTIAYSYFTDIPPRDIECLDISYNALLIMELYKYFSNEYFKRYRWRK
jgi:hypothetical protein